MADTHTSMHACESVIVTIWLAYGGGLKECIKSVRTSSATSEIHIGTYMLVVFENHRVVVTICSDYCIIVTICPVVLGLWWRSVRSCLDCCDNLMENVKTIAAVTARYLVCMYKRLYAYTNIHTHSYDPTVS